MGIIQNRLEQVNSLISAIKEHHMCLYFTEDEMYYQVQYPNGYFPEGIRIAKDDNKAKVLERLIPKMDEHWDTNYPS